MNNLIADIGYLSVNHYGEELCGDHLDVVTVGEDSTIIVLADGMGSGVKASILSTLTSKIISTLLAAGLSIEECVSTIAATLPVCSERGVAYSTFTIIHIIDNEFAELIQYDNPEIFLIRDGENYEYPMEQLRIDGKKIWKSKIRLEENDLFVAMSDGCPYAGETLTYNQAWKREDIIKYIMDMECGGFNAKTLATLLIEEVCRLYGEKPQDDATACVVRIRKRIPVNLLFGPPSNVNDNNRMMALFFGKEGKHIICGGTTASIASRYLGRPVTPSRKIVAKGIPPISEIEGVDLVTEGIITMSKVLENARNFLSDNSAYEQWGYSRDGASLITSLLIEEATDINFFVGKAVNPAHQDPTLHMNFDIKMEIVKELTEALKNMGKNVKVSYF